MIYFEKLRYVNSGWEKVISYIGGLHILHTFLCTIVTQYACANWINLKYVWRVKYWSQIKIYKTSLGSTSYKQYAFIHIKLIDCPKMWVLFISNYRYMNIFLHFDPLSPTFMSGDLFENCGHLLQSYLYVLIHWNTRYAYQRYSYAWSLQCQLSR